MTMQQAVQIHAQDSVAVAIQALQAGQRVTVGKKEIVLRQDIPAGHKFALRDIAQGENIYKYGNPIGHAKEDILCGDWVHVHNVATNLDAELSYSYHPVPAKEVPAQKDSFFGFVRKDGRVGVRNYIWIIPTVGCVNKVGETLAKIARPLLHGNVTDIVAFSHPFGCSQMTEDQENTRHILANLMRHPNAGGVLVLGLGCENSNISVMKSYLAGYDPARTRFLNCQDFEDEYAEGEKLLKELIDTAANDERVEVPMEKLIVGLKCGGSDGFSGLTANPVIGGFSDKLIACGGTTMLTEVTEMFGAEPLLMDRCENEQVFCDTVDMINGFKRYYLENGQTVYENPSPGNKAGGITTLEDKSLGCTQKCGSAPVRGVVSYGGQVTGQGLYLLSSPANDLVSSTALAAAGAQIVLFSTGRGTPFASPVPTVKIASNAMLSHKKQNWIDFDASGVLESGDYAQESEKLYAFVKEIANGKLLKSERQGLHDLSIFKSGVVL